MDSRTTGLLGAAILSFGVFSPIAEVTTAGTVTYFEHGRYGIVMLILAGISVVFACSKSLDDMLWATGFGALFLTGYSLFGLKKSFEQLNSIALDAGLVAHSGVSWGWGLLLIGSFLLLIGAWLATYRPSQVAP
jgi:hypothetical protein